VAVRDYKKIVGRKYVAEVLNYFWSKRISRKIAFKELHLKFVNRRAAGPQPLSFSIIYNFHFQLDIQRALEQDATVFEYDEVYDEMKGEKEEIVQSKKDKEAKKPKYMQSLLKTAEKRQQLNERRMERKVQKERDAENGEFDDKGKFFDELFYVFSELSICIFFVNFFLNFRFVYFSSTFFLNFRFVYFSSTFF